MVGGMVVNPYITLSKVDSIICGRALTTAFSSPCDIALGSFGPETPAGLVGEVDANAWADKVWSDHPDDQD
jgi:hypothetical protein